MPKKQIIIISAAVVIIVVGIVLLAGKFQKIGPNNYGPAGTTTGEAPKSATRADVPKDIKIPELGEKTSEGVAAPVSVSNAAPGTSAKLRTFNIKAENSLFDPSTVIAKIGDTIHINFTAVDKTYDMTLPDYGMKQTATKGETKIFEFQAVSEGKFTYYCNSCGGLDSKTKGYIIVAP